MGQTRSVGVLARGAGKAPISRWESPHWLMARLPMAHGMAPKMRANKPANGAPCSSDVLALANAVCTAASGGFIQRGKLV